MSNSPAMTQNDIILFQEIIVAKERCKAPFDVGSSEPCKRGPFNELLDLKLDMWGEFPDDFGLMSKLEREIQMEFYQARDDGVTL